MTTPRVRRTPAVLAAAALTSAGVVAGVAAPSVAADACEQPTIVVAAQAADVVFSGMVDTSEQVRRAGEPVREVTVAVERVYQGSVGRDLSTVRLSPDAPTPEPGTEWVFFADGEAPEFSASECSGSRMATAVVTRRVEDALGAGEVFVDPAPPQAPLTYEDLEVSTLPPLSRLLAPGAGLSLIAVLGLLVTRRRG